MTSLGNNVWVLDNDKLSGRADIGRYCQCLMQNTNNCIGKCIFSLFAPSK